ncbi:MAG: DUF1963 domain-containing protein [Candidatus Competibacteraceae bacterium]|nr:DUF1963 domain-containing protein [Candidatus Competibacteraceae bacterium]
MPTSQKIKFVTANSPANEHVTKFGGQPCWIEKPQWPLSKETGKPMRFIGQIALTPPVFTGKSGKMAYLFMTDIDDEYVDGTWKPDGGENAVVIHPGNYSAPNANILTGPTLYCMTEKEDSELLETQSVEFVVEFTITEEPPFAPEETRWSWSEEEHEKYASQLEGSKIGGAPLFLQGDEFPEGDEWKLLLQLDSTAVPFYVNFGDAGVAYSFINADESKGKLLWQCG